MPPPARNNTYVRDPFVDFGNQLNVFNAPLDLSGVFETGQVVVSSQFLFLPILLLVLGLLMYVAMALVHVCQWLCCCECKQKVFPTQQVEMLKDVLHNYQNCCAATFYTLCIYMLLVVQLIIFRRADALQGVQTAFDFSSFLVSEYTVMTTAAGALNDAAASLATDVKTAPSAFFRGNLTASAASLQSEAAAFSSGLVYTKTFLRYFQDTITTYLGNYYTLNFVIIGCYVGPMFCGSILAYCHWHRSKVGVRVFLLAGGITYLATLAASFVFLSATLVLANICMNPLVRFRDLAPPAMQSTFTYYASCFTANPLTNHSNVALTHLGRIDAIYNSTLHPPHAAASITPAGFLAHRSAARLALQQVQGAAPCPRVRARISAFVGGAVCGNMYTFAYSTWVAMQACALFMFLLFIIGIAAYQFDSDAHIDHFVDTHYNPDKAVLPWDKSMGGGGGSTGSPGGSSGRWAQSTGRSTFGPAGAASPRGSRRDAADEEKSVSEHRPAQGSSVFEGTL